jgi:hypothetical protein
VAVPLCALAGIGFGLAGLSTGAEVADCAAWAALWARAGNMGNGVNSSSATTVGTNADRRDA